MTPAKPNALWFLNSRLSICVSHEDSGDGISIIEQRAPFGEAPPLHVHRDEDEIFHILDGEVRFQVGEETRLVRGGETLLGRRGVPHGFRVVSSEGARLLIVTQGGFERMVRAGSRPAETDGLPEPADPTPAMLAQLSAVCAAQNIELLGPPIA